MENNVSGFALAAGMAAIGACALMLAKRGRINKPRVCRRIILVRHGESEGNINPKAYNHTPDHEIRLTPIGKKQAIDAGLAIKRLVGDEPCAFYVSPYLRTKETAAGIMRGLSDHQVIKIREEPRLREQEFGNFHLLERSVREARERYGRFFFRYASVLRHAGELVKEWPGFMMENLGRMSMIE